MAEDFLIETTNERGVVTQERVSVSVNETVLNLSNRSLVRIVGLEQATLLQKLNVTLLLVSHLTHSHPFRSFSFSSKGTASSTCQRVCSR
jgi:hypothetical protein